MTASLDSAPDARFLHLRLQQGCDKSVVGLDVDGHVGFEGLRDENVLIFK